MLAARLVEIYKADEPDVLTVVLEADGFGDLLERAEFLDRISDQDREITDRVRGLRDQAKDQAVQLADLEEREQHAAERDPRERDQIAAVRATSSCGSRDQLASARAERRGALAQVHDSRVSARGRPRGARARAGARAGRRSPGARRRARSSRARRS